MSDDVTLMFSGGANRDWESYEIDSDMLSPADGFRMKMGHPKPGWFDAIAPLSQVRLDVNGTRQLTGILDNPTGATSRRGSELVFQGRDWSGAMLVDNSAPVLNLESATLQTWARKIAQSAGVERFNWLPGSGDAIPLQDNEELRTNPGETCWNAIYAWAVRMGLGLWTDEQGRLCCGRPDYTGGPAYYLIYNQDPDKASGNNVETLGRSSNYAVRYSKVIVYGQRQGSAAVSGSAAAYDIVGEATDPEVSVAKTLRIVDYSAQSAGRATRRAQAEVALRKVESEMVEVVAAGHSQAGVVYQTNRLAYVKSDVWGLDGLWWIYRRRFTYDRERGQRTYLVLGPPNIWGVYGRN